MLLPIYSENHLKHIIDLLDSKKLEYVEIIASQTILKSIEQNEYFRENLIESKKVNMICTEKNLRIFLTYSKEFMALTLFFEDGHYDDSQMLIGKDKNALKWAQIIYSKYI
jgi:predicted transcriptional regulator